MCQLNVEVAGNLCQVFVKCLSVRQLFCKNKRLHIILKCNYSVMVPFSVSFFLCWTFQGRNLIQSSQIKFVRWLSASWTFCSLQSLTAVPLKSVGFRAGFTLTGARHLSSSPSSAYQLNDMFTNFMYTCELCFWWIWNLSFFLTMFNLNQ